MSAEQLCESNNCLWAKDISIQEIIFYFVYKELGSSNIEAMHKCQTSFTIEPPTISKVQQFYKELLNNDNI